MRARRHTVRTFFAGRCFSIDIRERTSHPFGIHSVDQLFADIFHAYVPHGTVRHGDGTGQTGGESTPYFLHTIITYKSGKTSCVIDGQRRLIGLLLIMNALIRLSASLPVNPSLTRQLSRLVYRIDRNGQKSYRITGDALSHIERSSLDHSLKCEMARRLATPALFQGFTEYLHSRVMIISLRVAPPYVPMVLASCNTRGEPYAQHELLRSQLLGMVPASDAESLSLEWDKVFTDIQDADQFTRLYLCATIAISRVDRVIFDGQCCEPLLCDDEQDSLKLGNREPLQIKRFISRLQRYASLYARLPEVFGGRDFRFLKEGCNYRSVCEGCLTVWECFALLVLATYRLDDPDEKMRIESVARGFDMVYVTLIENRAYSINDFEQYIFDLLRPLRDCLADQIESVMTANLETGHRRKPLARLIPIMGRRQAGSS